MKTTIIMIRHGQSVANAENRFAGHSDFDLTELGRKQAALAAKYWALIAHTRPIIPRAIITPNIE